MQDFWSPLQNIIMEVCLSFDKGWRLRKRRIDTQFLVLFIFKLVLSKNRQGYKSLLSELWEKSELSILQSTPISASSLCEARQKLSENVFIELNSAILSYQEEAIPQPRWCGHRIFAADGSKLNLPHELILEGYKAPNKGQYYPQGLMSVIYNVGSSLVHDCLLSNQSERRCLIKQMDTLSNGDVLVLDRGYFSYLVLHQATEKGIHLICRLQSGSANKQVEAFLQSDLNDTVINYSPSPPTSIGEDEEIDQAIKESHWQDLFNMVQKIKINFKNCLLVIARFIEKLVIPFEGEKIWLSTMLTSISKIRQKIRPGRHYPRCSRKPCTRWTSSNATKATRA